MGAFKKHIHTNTQETHHDLTRHMTAHSWQEPHSASRHPHPSTCPLPFPPLSLVPQRLKCLPAMRETRFQSLGREDPLEEEMATHSSILAWRIPWTEEPGGLQSTGSQRVGHNWATSLSLFFFLSTYISEYAGSVFHNRKDKMLYQVFQGTCHWGQKRRR